MKRREERGSARQIALSLRDRRLCGECIHVVRYNIENLIKFSQCFRELTKGCIQGRVLAEQGKVARVKPLGFVKVGFAFVPLTSPALKISQGLRNLATVR